MGLIWWVGSIGHIILAVAGFAINKLLSYSDTRSAPVSDQKAQNYSGKRWDVKAYDRWHMVCILLEARVDRDNYHLNEGDYGKNFDTVTDRYDDENSNIYCDEARSDAHLNYDYEKLNVAHRYRRFLYSDQKERTHQSEAEKCDEDSP